jgi:hypothetical protein
VVLQFYMVAGVACGKDGIAVWGAVMLQLD